MLELRNALSALQALMSPPTEFTMSQKVYEPEETDTSRQGILKREFFSLAHSTEARALSKLSGHGVEGVEELNSSIFARIEAEIPIYPEQQDWLKFANAIERLISAINEARR